jgi:hypothetical protein
MGLGLQNAPVRRVQRFDDLYRQFVEPARQFVVVVPVHPAEQIAQRRTWIIARDVPRSRDGLAQDAVAIHQQPHRQPRLI